MDISIVIISYNTRDLTLECIRSVLRETRSAEYEIIVLDNQSRDGSADAIEAEFAGSVRLIRSPDNVGFAAGNNIAAELARGQKLLLLNPDTIVRGGAIDKLLGFAAEHPTCGIWGGRTTFLDGSLNPTSCWRRLSLWVLFCSLLGLTRLAPRSELLNSECYGRWQRDTVRHVDIVTGCFFLVTTDLWRRLGGFDPVFFMYGEEADLCLRARKLGARPIITPAAEIVHYGSASDTIHADKAVAVLKGKATLIRRHFSRLRRPVGLALLAAMPSVKVATYSVCGYLLRRPQYLITAGFWREVGKRRRDWISGYAG